MLKCEFIEINKTRNNNSAWYLMVSLPISYNKQAVYIQTPTYNLCFPLVSIGKQTIATNAARISAPLT